MSFTPEQQRQALAAVKARTATKEQERKVAEMTRSGDPNRGLNAQARNAINGR